ncbi:MAG: inactive serine/threonine-protein kinase VRK3, partial [Myxococcota bacterium]
MSNHDHEASRCWSCEEVLPKGARFCMVCGAPQDERVTRQSPNIGHSPTAPAARALSGPNLPTRYIAPKTRLGIYVVEDVIGEGGMGVVYLGHDTVQQREVAIKVLHTNLVGDPGIRRRFAREARLMMGRPHPNVVKVFDTIDEEELVAIVMEYVEG